MKAIGKVGLIKTNLVGVRMTSPVLVTQDPNFYRIRELKPIPDPLLVLSQKGTQNIPSFIGDGTKVASKITRSLDEDNLVSRPLNLTSDIFNNLATSTE